MVINRGAAILLIISGGCIVLLGLFFAFLGIAFSSRDHLLSGPADRFKTIGENTFLRYRITDKGGPTVLLLHSFGSSLEMWNKVIDSLNVGRCVALDMSGQGLSKGSITGRYDLESQHRMVIALMDSLGIHQEILVGCSMGASVAAWTASLSPDRVCALLLIAPSALPGTMHHKWPMDYVYRPGIINSVLRSITETWIFKKYLLRSLALQSLDITGSYSNDFADSLNAIRQPVILVWSPDDRRVPFDASGRYLDRMKNVRLVKAAMGSGHNVPTADPALIARLIMELCRPDPVMAGCDAIRKN